jgi:prolipoprotein diacylglyceryl transferase
MILAFIPSPSQGVWHLGAFPIRGYALCIIAGVIAGVWLGERRWVQRGGQPGVVGDIAVWMVPFGLVGGRLYHVLTDPELYFGEGKSPITALYIWRGGLGIWGAVALGAVGAYIACRRRGIKFRAMADALAPAVVLGQAFGRWGNWFNQELFGKPTTLPWGLEIDPAHRPEGPDSDPTKYFDNATFHPTFLYECLWDLGVVGLVIWADRRFTLGYGRAFALYVMAYTAGRGWIEYLRIDSVNHLFGVRLNVWTSVVLFVAATIYFVVTGRRHPGRETDVQRVPEDDSDNAASGPDDAETDSDSDARAGSELEADGEADGDAEAQPDKADQPAG